MKQQREQHRRTSEEPMRSKDDESVRSTGSDGLILLGMDEGEPNIIEESGASMLETIGAVVTGTSLGGDILCSTMKGREVCLVWALPSTSIRRKK